MVLWRENSFLLDYGIFHARLGTLTSTGYRAVATMMTTIVHCTRENHNTEKNDKTSETDHIISFMQYT